MSCAATTPHRHEIVDSFLALVKSYWSDDAPRVLSPYEVLQGIRQVNPMFRGYQQHDSQVWPTCYKGKKPYAICGVDCPL